MRHTNRVIAGAGAVAMLLALAGGCAQGGGSTDAMRPAVAAGSVPAAVFVSPEAYLLPFAAGMTCAVGQGNFGVGGLGSHRGEYAIDFVMPERTAVLAARGGIVTELRQDCPNVNCPFDPDSCCGNFIKVRHADGTVGAYWHLVQDGSCVRLGDGVARGDVIGWSGNTGRSLMPHLHFAVFAAEGRPHTGGYGESRDGSMEVVFVDVPGSGVPVFLGTYTSQNQVARDWCK